MPWVAKEAKSHTRRASSPTAQRQWADVANSVLKRTGSDVKAIKAANAVVARRKENMKGK